jgi:acetyl-CoA carboxylase biotin carboxylase subunit
MFKKILIANRGEIALRILRACEALGIPAVTVHSEADAEAPHARLAPETYLIGPAPVSQSYLSIPALLDVAKRSGADAVHPGYGLLSENADFAEACAREGLTFIGPRPELLRMMGSKSTARAAMAQAGVPILPGSAELADVDAALAEANRFGYPVMLKATSGGGGIGMQVVHSDAELAKAYAMCSARAKAYFGDGGMYLEKFLDAPRHVEIQVLADHAGHAVHLNERECSIQRRHQKVVEEAPSPALDADLRARMGAVAVAAVRSLGYTNAGTFEFLMDAERNFYFLEMNTRLQVEHPVTELTTGVDLVAWQIRIAAGEALALAQADLEPRGHAIEVRIYAEDPVTFFPAPGTIAGVSWPAAPHVRIDTWVGEGTVVSPHYDPMLAKLIVHGEDRGAAISRLREALEATSFEGLKTNLPLLRQVADSPAFAAGALHTGFIAEHCARPPAAAAP